MATNPTPAGGFSEGELKAASFLVNHGPTLRRAVYGAFIFLNALSWGYVLWTLVDTYAISYPRESRLTEEIARNQIALSALEADRPARIETESVNVFQTTDGRLDLAVDAFNRNEQWWAEFTYFFNVSGEQTPRRTGIIMPGGRTVITELGYRPLQPGGRAAGLVVDEVRWRRVDPGVVGPDYAAYERERFNISFENVVFDRTLAVGSRQIGRTSFDLVNRGAYGYWNIGLAVKLLRGDTLLAVNKITLSNIVPGETRHIELEWHETLPPVTQTEIVPIVNFLDPDTYLPTQRF